MAYELPLIELVPCCTCSFTVLYHKSSCILEAVADLTKLGTVMCSVARLMANYGSDDKTMR